MSLDDYFFPPGYDWAVLLRDQTKNYPRMIQLAESFGWAIVLTIIRFALNKLVFAPIARRALPKDKATPKHNYKHVSRPELVEFFRAHNKPKKRQNTKGQKNGSSQVGNSTTDKNSDSSKSAAAAVALRNQELQRLAEKTNQDVELVMNWFAEQKHNYKVRQLMIKFLDTSWQFSVYVFTVILGFYVLSDKPWLTNTDYCWIGYPIQEVDADIRFYYTVSLGLYIHLMVAIFVEERKKDFYEMVIHHIATIVLIVFSWYCNYVRIGSLVLLLHDVSDPLLQGAKLLNYSELNNMCDATFVLFAITFAVARLYYFPFYVIRSAYTGAITLLNLKPFFSYYFFNVMLCVLLVIHIYWFFLILKMVYKFVVVGKVEKDERSATEDEDEQNVNDKSKHE